MAGLTTAPTAELTSARVVVNPRLTADRQASGECLDGEHEASDCKPSDERHRVAVEHRGDDRAAECRGAEVARPSLVDKG